MSNLGDRPLMTSLEPGVSPPSFRQPRGCPRCGSLETTLDEIDYRFLLLSLLKATTCNKCKFQFSAVTGTGTMPIIIAAYTVPLLLFVAIVAVVLLFAA